MNGYPTRVLSLSSILAGLLLACAPRHLAVEDATLVPAPPSRERPHATMSGTESARERATSLDQMLVGRLSGVTVSPAPGGGMIVRMGGPTSFYGSQSPLFVIDGMPIETDGTLSWLDPHDVASIQALKDPSGTAIYGVRGANGVIVIWTKGSH